MHKSTPVDGTTETFMYVVIKKRGKISVNCASYVTGKTGSGQADKQTSRQAAMTWQHALIC